MGDLKTIGSAIESYVTDWSFAPQLATFVTVAAGAAWFEPFYIKIVPKKDGWGNTFMYVFQTGGDQYSVSSGGRGIQATELTVPTPDKLYDCTALSDFNLDICYSNGLFTCGPVVKR
ncbi:MAG: type II secretion system protein GspG [Kiritimatiellae bacterium]|nr:type II secretion system protein GspG [Kiritimatiellia bacterium]MCG2812741.1 type II secretion system protein GspG [Candidatus Aminicenantes bacterium]